MRITISLAWISSLSLLHGTRCFSIVNKPIRRKESSLLSSSADDDLAKALQRSQSTSPLDQLFDRREKPKWFESLTSLPFECTECGKCCQTKGDVYLNPAETKNAADLLDLSVAEFKEQHVSRVEHFPTDRHEIGWTVLKHQEEDGITQCVFLKDNKCGIYGARPLQCSTYPFWPRFMDDVEGWNNEVIEEGGEKLWSYEEGGCEGMQHVTEAKDVSTEGVSLSKATEQLELYKRYKKRFPRDDLVPVENSSL